MGKKVFQLIAVGAIALPLWNYLCKKSKQSIVKGAYGQVVNVDGCNMIVEVAGEENKPTIVLLPGWGSPSPVLEFRPLAEELANDFRVITIEPFGYGLSDKSNRERVIDTIVEELHECVQRLGCNRYYLMAHSISGVYSLYWANIYPQEVQGFIGIDCSVPKQFDNTKLPISVAMLNQFATYLQQIGNMTGITRLRTIRHPECALNADFSYPYSEKELEIFQILGIDYANNRTVMDELKRMEENLDVVRNMKFPEHIPVLHFISADSCKISDTWEQLHRNVITEKSKSEVLYFGKTHDLHLEQRQNIVKKVKTWVDK